MINVESLRQLHALASSRIEIRCGARSFTSSSFSFLIRFTVEGVVPSKRNKATTCVIFVAALHRDRFKLYVLDAGAKHRKKLILPKLNKTLKLVKVRTTLCLP